MLAVALGSNVYAESLTNEPKVIEVENALTDKAASVVNEEEGDEAVESDTDSEQVQRQLVYEKLEVALQSLEADGMTNLYSKMRKREKRKWFELVNENNYFESDTKKQYQLSGVYEIGPNQYFLIGWGGAADEKLTLVDHWSEEKKQSYVPEGIFQLVLTQEGDHYFVTHAVYPSETMLSSEELALYKKEEQEESNVAIEYNKVRKLDDVEEYVDYLDQAIGEVSEEGINDNAKSEVTQYVQYAIENASSDKMVAEENTIQVKEEVLSQMKNALTFAKDKFGELLNKNDISFNKSLNTVLRLQAEKVSFKEPIYIQLPDLFEDLGEVTGLRILLDDKSYIYIEGTDFEKVAGLKIRIERLKDKSTYDITFLNAEDEVIDQIDALITFALPAKDEFSTVLASYGEESQNWGGQYDTTSSTISFGTKYSGQYKIVDNNVKIKDVNGLPSSQQSAIKFMVSKGYLSLENDHFYPDATFTRYEFAEALVKMFFALDTSLTTSFKDVSVDSPYYPYVASGETYDIIKGYADNTFKGEVEIPVEQVLSLCARTIADKKGYVYPKYIEDYIKFADSEEIAKWAINDIALAVQSGLVTSGGNLSPKAEITRAESAEILYKLFMLLHETAPGEVVEITPTQKTYSVLGVLLLAILAIWIIRRFIKKNKVIITMIICTAVIVITIIIGFKGGF